jgi:hypothetical protein
VMITGRAGNTLTIGGLLEAGQTVPGRGQEGTLAQAFAAGTRVEGRVTRDTLSRTSKNLAPLASYTLLKAPKDSYQDGYVVSSYDPTGNPGVLVAKDVNTWRFLNYISQFSKVVTASAVTSVSASSLVLSNVVAGKYLIQFTSGVLAGQIRPIDTNAANAVTWTGAVSPPASIGDTFEILEAQVSILADFSASNGVPIGNNGGTADIIDVAYAPAITSLTNNMVVLVVLSTPTTSPTPTFSPNGLAAKTIVGYDGGPLISGQLNGTIVLRYDSSTQKWWLVAGGVPTILSVQPLSFFIGNF